MVLNMFVFVDSVVFLLFSEFIMSSIIIIQDMINSENSINEMM